MAARLTPDHDLTDLIRKARQQGFDVRPTSGGHLRVQASGGAFMHMGSTPKAYTALTNFRAWLKAHGLTSETPQERRRRERKQAKTNSKHTRPPEPYPSEPGPGRPKLAFRREPAAQAPLPPPPDPWRQGGTWTLAQARDLIRQGYQLDYAVRRTGWGPAWLHDA